ncbi:MAG: hypothetical protein JKY17_04380 [Magnetovibrio sp.]|nr:hypothetical protein [Magnetovibrio sp.]
MSNRTDIDLEGLHSKLLAEREQGRRTIEVNRLDMSSARPTCVDCAAH